MSGSIHELMGGDHDRLQALLAEAAEGAGEVARGPFDAFRALLLRHIRMEERAVLPEAQRALGGAPHPTARRLTLEHGALAELLVAEPTRTLLGEIGALLERHRALEEGDGGVYETCDRLLAGPDAARLVEELLRTPAVTLPGGGGVE